MKWISVKDKLPPHGVNVLVAYVNDWGKNRIVIGHYLERWREESYCDECSDEYSEELDNYFLKQGWYENLDNWGDYSSVVIHEGEVSHWAELPPFPNGKEVM